MPARIRKQVYLDAGHDRELKRMARATGKTEASIIREALDHLVLDTRLEKERLQAWNAEREFIGQWMAKGPVPGRQRRWRREDLYDRKSPH
jgi:hypothetical protein